MNKKWNSDYLTRGIFIIQLLSYELKWDQEWKNLQLILSNYIFEEQIPYHEFAEKTKGNNMKPPLQKLRENAPNSERVVNSS